MDDGTALLRAIIAFPDEDVPRLAYADWLDENGQAERAEFIRVQCELDRVEISACHIDCGYHGSDCKRCHEVARLRGQSQRIIERNALPTLGWDRVGFAPGRRHGYRVVTERVVEFSDRTLIRFSRGFVSAVELPAADWLTHADTILAAHPVVEVTLNGFPIFPSGGNDTYYVGNLGVFPEKYWRRLDSLPSRSAAELALREVLAELWPRVRVWNFPRETPIYEDGDAWEAAHQASLPPQYRNPPYRIGH